MSQYKRVSEKPFIFHSQAFYVDHSGSVLYLEICAHPSIFWSEFQQETDDIPYRVVKESLMKGLLSNYVFQGLGYKQNNTFSKWPFGCQALVETPTGFYACYMGSCGSIMSLQSFWQLSNNSKHDCSSVHSATQHAHCFPIILQWLSQSWTKIWP